MVSESEATHEFQTSRVLLGLLDQVSARARERAQSQKGRNAVRHRETSRWPPHEAENVHHPEAVRCVIWRG